MEGRACIGVATTVDEANSIIRQRPRLARPIRSYDNDYDYDDYDSGTTYKHLGLVEGGEGAKPKGLLGKGAWQDAKFTAIN